MRCFYVLVHGRLRWRASQGPTDAIGVDRPAGFWCHRYVLAADKIGAENKAFRRVSENLEREFGWLSSGAATVDLEVAEVTVATLRKLIKPDNKGHTFYAEE